MNPTGLIRSGWWVAVAAVVVSILVIIAVLRASFGTGASRGDDPIVLEPSLIPEEQLVRAMARDGLKALNRPATLTPAEVDRTNEEERGKLLVPSDRVIGVAIDGEARAYPLRLLRWHETVNDVVGGRPIAVTYSPLSGGIAVWDRSVAGREIEFGVSGWLTNSNTLLYDRRAAGRTVQSLAPTHRRGGGRTRHGEPARTAPDRASDLDRVAAEPSRDHRHGPRRGLQTAVQTRSLPLLPGLRPAQVPGRTPPSRDHARAQGHGGGGQPRRPGLRLHPALSRHGGGRGTGEVGGVAG